jgi:hypothetical protein
MSGLTLVTGSPSSIYDPSALAIAPQRLRDNAGKLKVSESQNLFEADFEYGLQPMRWENYTVGGGSVVQKSALGGVQMSVTSASGDLVIRQTRPYIRYQPGKTMYMSSGMQFGAAVTNQRQRVGFFDDGNGLFWEQGDPTATNPSGMGVVYRSDTSGTVTDTRISYENWSDPYNIKSTINWNLIQMIWIEYAWYGAGLLRWGVMINGEPWTLHQVGVGNLAAQTAPWARTGNIPIRYEMRNIGASTAGSMNHYGVSVLAEGKIDTQRGFTYGYGFTGTAAVTRAPGASANRYPLLSLRYRVMGTLEYGVDTNYSGANGSLPAGGAAISSVTQNATNTVINLTGTPLVASAWVGKYVFCRGTTAAITSITVSGASAPYTATVTTSAANHYLTSGRYLTISGATTNTSCNGTFPITVTGANTFTYQVTTSGNPGGTIIYAYGQGGIGRITANTTSALTVVDNVTGNTPMITPPAASGNYIIGEIDRGQILPQTLNIYSSANCTLELISTTYQSPISLTSASWSTMYSLGSLNSFAERDVSATALTGGEVVYNTPLPSGGLQNFDLTQFFPLYNSVQGNQPDVLTVAITTPSGFSGNIGASIIGQEAMS